MRSIASSAGVRRLFATSILARLPLAMLSIGLLVHVRHLSGSFAAAGVVTGVYAIALGVGGPLLGQLVDRRGQTRVLLASASIAAALLVAIAVQPVGASLAVLVALAVGIGLAEPPVGACLRTQLPALLSDPSAVRAAYALEASVVELTFIFGPPLALCIGALWSTGAALAAGGIVLLVATAAFAAQPASRSWRPAPAQRRPRGGSLRTPAMRTLVIVLIAVGVLLGADEVAVVAAAKTLDSATAAAPLLALWGAGSFVGGLLAARLGGGARTAAGLALVLGALTAGHLALIPAAGSLLALAGVLLLAGAAIAPTEATVYAMLDHAAPAGTITEAFAWLATAMAVGGAVGAASAGLLADRAGPTAAFALAGGAGALAVLATLLRSRTLVRRAPAIADTVAATGTASIVASSRTAPACGEVLMAGTETAKAMAAETSRTSGVSCTRSTEQSQAAAPTRLPLLSALRCGTEPVKAGTEHSEARFGRHQRSCFAIATSISPPLASAPLSSSKRVLGTRVKQSGANTGTRRCLQGSVWT